MKHWLTLAAVIAGLSFVLYFQLAPHFQPIDAAAAAPANDQRSIQQRKPAAPPKKQQKTPTTFGAYPCPRDCSVDKAGYQWAARNSIGDPDDCTGSTAAFIEGCRVYAERQAARTAAD
jgi:predicted lipid-binding transport protein (Tim44 family)